MIMWLAPTCAALLLAQQASAQMAASDAQCEAQLVQISGNLNTACGCANGGCDSGVPSSCDATCAALFLPFWSSCESFVQSSLPELADFGPKCQHGIGSTPVPPPTPVPTGAAGPKYVRVALSLKPGAVPVRRPPCRRGAVMICPKVVGFVIHYGYRAVFWVHSTAWSNASGAIRPPGYALVR
jgi:hypothetical protein